MRDLKIAVTTPVHNRKELTLECLRSLFACDLSGLLIHCVIVDDGSTDGTSAAISAEFPDIQLVQGTGSLWYTEGMNVGIRAALKHDPDFILAINNDSTFDPDFLQSMTRTAIKHAKSIVGSVLIDWDSKEEIFQVAPKWSVWWGGMRHWYKQTVHSIPDRPWKVELIVGNCVLFPTDVIREVGLMDSKRLPQYGDAEYTPRMRKAGWDLLIDPNSRVYCKPNDIPERIRSMGVTKLISKMLFDPFHPHSLKRRLNMNLGSAPSKLQGYLAFLIFFFRLFIGKNMEGKWALEQTEMPLSEMYRDNIV